MDEFDNHQLALVYKLFETVVSFVNEAKTERLRGGEQFGAPLAEWQIVRFA